MRHNMASSRSSAQIARSSVGPTRAVRYLTFTPIYSTKYAHSPPNYTLIIYKVILNIVSHPFPCSFLATSSCRQLEAAKN
jgi:hypothetical protein